MHFLAKTEAESLVSLLARRPHVGGIGPVEQFVLQYVFFEAILRIILSGYKLRFDTRGKHGQTSVTINKKVVYSSFEYFGIEVSNEQVDNLLDSKRTKRGTKSARALRNALIHEWKEEDAREVEERSFELLGLLSSAIQAIARTARGAP